MKSRALFLLFFILVLSTEAKIRHSHHAESEEKTSKEAHHARFVEKSAHQDHAENKIDQKNTVEHKEKAEHTTEEATANKEAVKKAEQKASKFLAEKSEAKKVESKSAATNKIKKTLSKAKVTKTSAAEKAKFKQTDKHTGEEEEETEEETGMTSYSSTTGGPNTNTTISTNSTNVSFSSPQGGAGKVKRDPSLGAEFEDVKYVQQLDPTVLQDIKYINDPSQHTKLERVGMNEYKIDGIVYETPTIYGDVVYHSLTDSTTVDQKNIVDKQRLWGQDNIGTFESGGVEYQEVNRFGKGGIPIDTRDAAPDYYRPPNAVRAFASPDVTQTVGEAQTIETVVTPKTLEEQKEARAMLDDLKIPHSKIAQHIVQEEGIPATVQLGGSDPTLNLGSANSDFLTAQYEEPEIRYDVSDGPKANFDKLKDAIEETLQQGAEIKIEEGR